MLKPDFLKFEEKGQDRKHDGHAEGGEEEAVDRFIPIRQPHRVSQYFPLDKDHHPHEAISKSRAAVSPVPGALRQLAVAANSPRSRFIKPMPASSGQCPRQKDSTYSSTRPCRTEKAKLEPAASTQIEGRDVERGGDGKHDRKNLAGWSSPRNDRRLIGSSRLGQSRYRSIAVRSNANNPQRPDRPARPRSDGDHLPPEVGKTHIWMLAQRDRVVGERNDRESANHEGQAKPPARGQGKNSEFPCEQGPSTQKNPRERRGASRATV